MRLVLLSDTHNQHTALDPLPAGDVLVHAGDVSGEGTIPEIQRFLAWFAAQPHPHKLFIAGNHDFGFEQQGPLCRSMVPADVTYLEDAGTCIDGVSFWGSPWQPEFYDWAFNLPRGPSLARRWAAIPPETQVLITHGPPYGILDETADGRRVGCQDLHARLPALPHLAVHVFGHIHEGYGVFTEGRTRFVNASTCTRAYEPTNPPIVVDL